MHWQALPTNVASWLRVEGNTNVLGMFSQSYESRALQAWGCAMKAVLSEL